MREYLSFPDDLFYLREGEQNFLGGDSDAKIATDYFISLIGRDAWEERRLKTAKHFLNGLAGIAVQGKGEYFQSSDLFGWYLFVAESFNEHPWNYEFFSGARIVPVFTSIGRNLENLRKVDGFEGRAKELISSAKKQPNGPLFEFLVAGAYLNDGAAVRFVPTQKGKKKTHDLEIRKDGRIWAAECKRMETSEYGENERMRMRELWKPVGMAYAAKGISVYADISFKVEFTQVPDDYLISVARAWNDSKNPSYLWEDAFSRGVIGELDIIPAQENLRTRYLTYPSSRLIEVVTGSYRRNDNHLSAYRMKFGPSPKVIDELDMAIICRWQNTSEESITKKARDIRRKLSDANDQLPSNMPGVIHVGIEAVDGDEVEKRRYDKIIETIKSFDPKRSSLEFVYCHYFAPEAPPDQNWAFDETFTWYGIRPNKKPLGETKLILPDDIQMCDGLHWQ